MTTYLTPTPDKTLFWTDFGPNLVFAHFWYSGEVLVGKFEKKVEKFFRAFFNPHSQLLKNLFHSLLVLGVNFWHRGVFCAEINEYRVESALRLLI